MNCCARFIWNINLDFKHQIILINVCLKAIIAHFQQNILFFVPWPLLRSSATCFMLTSSSSSSSSSPVSWSWSSTLPDRRIFAGLNSEGSDWNTWNKTRMFFFSFGTTDYTFQFFTVSILFKGTFHMPSCLSFIWRVKMNLDHLTQRMRLGKNDIWKTFVK